ncbi:hypothetical protein [Altibacter sp. HG106]|uniref:hypothetical protein n=1 Tax=Altibacter sp. HG106 TaxID=3023937 RepID=UPI002350519E|nr:hypothetical protein [Altibacter sp. HG106]MDC7993749.1 hypothetical protein [Altibacter sp. HG106]
MELAKVEVLLERYFNAETTLQEEQQLGEYFANEEVPLHLAAYKTLFQEWDLAKTEVSHQSVSLPSEQSGRSSWWYGIAAAIIVGVGVAGYQWSQPSLSLQEQEALAAFEKSKEAMLLLSENFNKGAEDLVLIGEFTQAKNKILK